MLVAFKIWINRYFRVLVLAATGAGAAVGAGWLVLENLGTVKQQALRSRHSVAMVDAVLAVGDLAPGQPIAEADVLVGRVPAFFLGDRAALSVESVVGRTPRAPILAGEVVSEFRLADPEVGAGLNALVPIGQRAISVNISRGAALSGFLEPGNRVDVLATLEADDGLDPATVMLLQDAPVLAVNEQPQQVQDHRAVEPGRFRPSVTLAVLPEQAEHLAHAEKRGELRLALRSPLDSAGIRLTTVDSADLLPKAPVVSQAAVVRRVAPRKEESTLVIIRAGQSTRKRVIDGEVQR
jgi:pilus assembly protein CpaB